MSPPDQNLVDVVCPACGEQYHLRREALGRRIECVNKLCRQRFVAEPHVPSEPHLPEVLPAEPPSAEALPTEPPLAEALPPEPERASHSPSADALTPKRRPSRTPRRGQPRWAVAIELVGAATIVVLGIYVGWNQVRQKSADSETAWQSLQTDYQDHKWAHAREGFARYVEHYPDSPHTADAPFFISMCEAGDKVYSPTGDITRGLTALEKVFRTHRDSAAYRDYAADLFQAAGRLVERFTERAKRTTTLDDLKQARQALADVRHAREAQSLLKTVAQSMKDVWVPERVAKHDRQIGETEAEVRGGLARKEIVRLFAGIPRLAVGDNSARVYERADRLLAERAELLDDPRIARARAAAYRADAGRVRFQPDAAASVPGSAADTDLRVVERDVAKEAVGTTLAVVWRAAMSERGSRQDSAASNIDSNAVVVSLVDGILYAFDVDGGCRWARRLGLDTSRLPLHLPATATTPDTLVAMSADQGDVIALDAETGETRWSYRPTSPATGHLTLVSTTVPTAGQTGGLAKQRLLLPTAEGRIDVIETVLGKRLGYFEIGWPLSVGGAHDPATGLIYFPTDAGRIFALDAAAIDGRGEACRSVLVTQHASGSLTGAPLVVGPYLVLVESADLDHTRVRAFGLGDSGFAEPGGAALAEQTLAGWSWYPPLATPDRLLLATDQGDLGLFGFNLDNPSEALYRLIDDDSQQAGTAIDSGALAVRAEGRLLWVMAGGRLSKLGIDIINQRITRLWPDGPSAVAGAPLHPAQVETGGDRSILFLTTSDGAARRELTAVVADSGQRQWRRTLGISPLGDPAAAGDGALLVDRTGGIAAIGRPAAGAAAAVNIIEPDVGELPTSQRGAAGSDTLAPSADGREASLPASDSLPDRTIRGEPLRILSDSGAEYVLQSFADGADIRLRPVSAESRWQVRRLPSPLAGRPVLLGDVLIAPCADGLLHRVAGGKGPVAENEQPFQWVDHDRQPRAAELLPLAEQSIVVSDGWRVRRLTYGVEQTIGQWREVSPPYVSADRLVGRPAAAGDRLFVADENGVLVALAADAPAGVLRSWSLAGRPASDPFVRGGCVLVVVDDRRLVCVAADSNDEHVVWTTAAAGRICGQPQLAGNVLLVADTSGMVTGIRLTDGGEAWRVELGAGRAPAASAVALGDNDMLVPLVDRTLLVAPLPEVTATDESQPSPSAAVSGRRGTEQGALPMRTAPKKLPADFSDSEVAPALRDGGAVAQGDGQLRHGASELRYVGRSFSADCLTALAVVLSAVQAAKTKDAATADDEEEEPPLDAPPGDNDNARAKPAKPGKPPKSATADGGADTASDQQDSDELDADVYDRVVYLGDKGSPRELRIRPYPDWLQLPLPATRGYRFQLYSRKASAKSYQQIAGGRIQDFECFELRLAEEAALPLGVSFEKLSRPGIPISLSTDDDERQAKTAVEALRKVLAEHDSAAQRGLRRGPKWAERVRGPLASAIFNLQLGHIDALLRQDNGAEARHECERLADELATAPAASQAALRERFETLLLGAAESAAGRKDYRLARGLLDEFVGRFAGEPGERAARLAQRLRDEAQRMVRQAEGLPPEKERDALALLDSAATASPDLQAIDDVRRRLSTAYPILDCAYGELPTNLLPQTARLPVERQVAALLFESLVRFDDGAEGGPGFVPRLVEYLPLALAKGRLAGLPHAPPIKWSDYSAAAPHLLTAADIDWSVRLARRESSPGHSPAWASLVASAQPAGEREAFTSAIRLTRDYWQPLALLQFPVLPKHRFPQQGTADEWAAFEQDPVGTGPYRLGRRTDDTLELLANSNYRRAGAPLIRQIMLHRFDPAEAVLQFLDRKVQLVHGLPPKQVDELRGRGGRVEKLVSPSVWFLGVNYRHAALNNQDLRLAVANAIDRPAILDECFRPSNGAGDHQPLTGPFPRDSWAYNADVPAFDTVTAKPLANQARRKLGSLPPLKLVVRAGEPGAALACEKIRQQCQAAGVDLTVEPLKADQFFFQVTVQHDYDFVYWRHDFPDDTYWLGALLDSDPKSRLPGGTNFMGYVPDASVAEFERDLLLHKRFVDIQAISRKLHAHLARTATLIPLWQLDTYVAVSDSLAGVKLTPLGRFDDIEHWRRQ